MTKAKMKKLKNKHGSKEGVKAFLDENKKIRKPFWILICFVVTLGLLLSILSYFSII